MISYIAATHNEKILYQNLMKSNVVTKYGVYVESECKNVSKAYNWLSEGKGMCCFTHHDVYLPKTFEDDLLHEINILPDGWAVIGVAGVKIEGGVKKLHGNILDRGRPWGSPNGLPAEVDTLDELLIVTRGDLRFDEKLPFDFYAADICMQAREQGRKCYAINAYCEHNSSRPFGGRTKSFYESEKYFKNKWKKYLPIATTCSLLNAD